jgi:diguanylate cyclase (GGDEF)-like protein/PAS domain S-box-containing protein
MPNSEAPDRVLASAAAVPPARLLIIDDEIVMRRTLSSFLARSGFLVDEAEGGQAGLERIAEHTYDTVLLDVSMPDLDGYAVLASIRARFGGGALPVIMITGNDAREDVIRALNAGANDYVTKPVDFPIALARIHGQVARRRSEAAMRDSQERYALAVAGSDVGIWDWDLRADTVYYSPRWVAMLGCEPGEIGKSPSEWFDRVHPQDIERLRNDIASHIEGINLNLQCEYRIRHKSRTYRWMRTRGTSLRGESGRSLRIAGSTSDISDSKLLDALTALPNRVLFTDRLDQAIARKKRRPDYRFAVLMMELDRLGNIRQSFGQSSYDQLLVAAGRRLSAQTRPSDSIATLGENIFAVLIDDVRASDDAITVLSRLRDQLQRPFAIDGEDIFVSLRAGVVSSDSGHTSAEAVLRDANAAMTSAAEGEHKIFDAEMHARAVRRVKLEAGLRRALESQQFTLFYQPICALPEGGVAGFEGLIRWRHPELGMVPPADFVPLSEETGLIVPIGQWVLEAGFAQLKEWTALEGGKGVFMSLNVSGRQLADERFVDQVAQALRQSRIDPAAIRLEITESAIMRDVALATDILRRLKEHGLRIAMDDFGTGYSSLSLLQRLPIDTIKIDRSFVIKMAEGAEGQEVMRTIINLSHNLGKNVVAEGVETPAQAAMLAEMGCEYGQGYGFAKPVDVDAASAMIGRSLKAKPES